VKFYDSGRGITFDYFGVRALLESIYMCLAYFSLLVQSYILEPDRSSIASTTRTSSITYIIGAISSIALKYSSLVRLEEGNRIFGFG
jgi:hypothetical protein